MKKVTTVTIFEKHTNSRALDVFMFSFIEPCLDGLKDCLHADGEFLGYSKHLFIAKTQKLFYSLNDKNVKRVFVNRGICLDSIPGADVLEIRFALEGFEFDDLGCYTKELGDGADQFEIVLRFSFEFKDGKIFKVCKTKSFTGGLNYKSESILENLN